MSQDPRHPFDTERFLEGFTEEVHEHQVDPDSPLGRAMAEARAAWTVTPVPVTLDDE